MKRPPAPDGKDPTTQCLIIEEARRRDGSWSGMVEAHTEYQEKPVEWIVEKLGIKEETIRWSMSPEYEGHEWDGTENPLVVGLEAISRYESIAVSAGTGTSKTHTLGACLMLFFLATRDRSIVLSIAPKQEQLLLNLWKEVAQLWPKFKVHFPDAELLSGKLRMLGEAEGREVWTATAFAAGVGADEEVAQRLAGFHQPSMLWLVEEGPGVHWASMNTIINTAIGGGNVICVLGNPDHKHDTLGLFSAKSWVKSIRISALDYPNIVLGRDFIPGAVTQRSIDRRLADADGDENDPLYLSRVRGIAPAQSKHALVLWDWCESAATDERRKATRGGESALGVDVADSPTGDCSSFSHWDGACCTDVTAFHAEDASDVGRMVHGEIHDRNNPINPRYVGVDSVGVGASTVNELKRLGDRIRLISGGMRAIPGMDTEERWSETEEMEDGQLHPRGARVPDVGRYANQRSQVFWRLREDLRLGRIALPHDKRLFEELTALEYDDSNGKITVVPKKQLKVRLGGRSPDRADALAYGNWARPRRPARRSPDEMKKPKNRNFCDGLEKLTARIKKRRAAEDRRFARRFKGKT